VTDSCPIKLACGVIGNGRVPALVAPSAHLGRLCMPRLDSAPVFARTLDVEHGMFDLMPDIEPRTGALLGNFSQAYTHVESNNAVTISELIEAREMRFRAWH
jgi:hypothetical protein